MAIDRKKIVLWGITLVLLGVLFFQFKNSAETENDGTVTLSLLSADAVKTLF